jgi:hypothetical protein
MSREIELEEDKSIAVEVRECRDGCARFDAGGVSFVYDRMGLRWDTEPEEGDHDE